MEEKLALPCFKLATQEEFDKAEKEAIQTVQLVLNGNKGIYLQSGSRKDPTDTTGHPARVLGIDLRGAATAQDTRDGVLLRCKLVMDNGSSITKYYAPAAPLYKVDKTGRGAKDSAFVYFTPELTRDIEHVEITALTLTQGHRTRYVGRD